MYSNIWTGCTDCYTGYLTRLHLKLYLNLCDNSHVSDKY